MHLPKIVVHKGKTEAILRFHPWIFSGAIKIKEPNVKNDELVEVTDIHGNFLAVGYYTESNIAVRILSFKPVADLETLFREKLKTAFNARNSIGLTDSEHTNAYRLVHAEGDGLAGLIIDFYNGVAVVQAHSVFMAKQTELITRILCEIYGEKLQAVYNKSTNTLPKHHHLAKDGFLYGNAEYALIKENKHSFKIDFINGQKTGFFIDQRDNRKLLAHYAKGKNVLNTFCYTGGFSVYAANAGANKVVSVDSSEKAIALTDENIQLNNAEKNHVSASQDVFDFLKTVERNDFDIIVLDPPAFAKNISARHHALQAYQRLNLAALKKIKQGGILFTFSCSQVVTADLFRGAVMAAAIEAGREVRILHQLTQPADHPVNIFHPEGNYLKGLMLLIN